MDAGAHLWKKKEQIIKWTQCNAEVVFQYLYNSSSTSWLGENRNVSLFNTWTAQNSGDYFEKLAWIWNQVFC